jgi:hypothetical protein
MPPKTKIKREKDPKLRKRPGMPSTNDPQEKKEDQKYDPFTKHLLQNS